MADEDEAVVVAGVVEVVGVVVSVVELLSVVGAVVDGVPVLDDDEELPDEPPDEPPDDVPPEPVEVVGQLP